MAPQQELQKLILHQTAKQQRLPSFGGSHSSQEEISGDSGTTDASVIVVQPNSPGKKNREGKGRAGTDADPRNCRHIEAVLFFFGVAGMIVSVLMLIQHLVIPYY